MACPYPTPTELIAPSLPRVTPTQIVDLVNTEGPNSVLLVDCRDDDRFGNGHPPGSLHAPSASFENRIPGLVDTVKSVQPGRVVFFCALSQVRGPTCAQKFADAVANIPELKDVQTTVLENGVTGWKEQFGGACDCPDAPCTHKLELLKA